jgi:hypothetical protein
LVSAYAAELAGWEPVIISDTRRPSGMFGAQYLHEPIPNVTPNTAVRISYQLRGTADGYRERVYGSKYVPSVSPQDMEAEHDAWDLRETYQRLWERFVGNRSADELKLLTVKATDIEPIKDSFDFVISTIPADKICPGWNVGHIDKGPGHWFEGTEIWAAGDAPEIGITLPYVCPDNTVVCNGDPDGPAWYRLSRIYGRLSIEWPGYISMPPLKTLAKVTKPVETNCDCWLDDRFMRVGRYGEWRKGALVHEAFNTVYQKLIEGKS